MVPMASPHPAARSRSTGRPERCPWLHLGLVHVDENLALLASIRRRSTSQNRYELGSHEIGRNIVQLLLGHVLAGDADLQNRTVDAEK